MRIGVAKEIKNHEYRVALTPAGAGELTAAGHQVLVESRAGIGAGFSDQHYSEAGATLANADDVWACELVVKVKEPQEQEYQYLNGQMVFTFFHLAGVSPALTQALLATRTTAIAYESLENARGQLPILAPMSAIAGNMAAQVGCFYLAKPQGGKGVQLGQVLDEKHGKVLVIGDGVVGVHAARIACAMGASVTIAGLFPERIPYLKQQISPAVEFIQSTPQNIRTTILSTDLVVGAVLCHGEKATHVVSEEMVRNMEPGSVLVDVSIDQGGCIATTRPTSHADPVFVRHAVTHYCVTNMPGAFPKTSTLALTLETLPYIQRLANKGISALGDDSELASAVNTYAGVITCLPVATALDQPDDYQPLADLLSSGNDS